MIPLFFWLLTAIVTIIALGITFPEETLVLCQKLRRRLKANYAKHRGRAAADKVYPPLLWVAQPWERHWQSAETPPPTPLRLRDLWKHRLVGLPNFLKLAALVWLIRADLIKVERVREVKG